jgi:hypothetical protein
MFELKATGWSYQEDLQLVQADIEVNIEDTIVLDEPFCVQVGMASLLLSAFQDVHPRQFSETYDWREQPFFICGCGDPSCRAALFEVKHHDDGTVEWCELMQSETGGERRGDSYRFGLAEYRTMLVNYAEQYVAFLRVEGRVLGEELKESLSHVEPLLQRLTDQTSIG